MAATSSARARAEQLAAQHLCDSGMTIIDTAWQCRVGTIDLIALDNDVTVFVHLEVNANKVASCGPVPIGKQQVIRKLAMRWINQQIGAFRRVRFDAVTVSLPPDSNPQIDHIESAF